MIDYSSARKAMVDTQLRTSAVTDRRVLNAMGTVERERFVPGQRRQLAYIDDVHPINETHPPRYLAAPAPFAKLIQLADVGPGHRVLDVAAGTGYSSAVLAELAAHVVALEADPELAAMARDNLGHHANIEVVEGDLAAGAPDLGPFDVIVIEGAVESVPGELLDQLRDGGRLAALVRNGAIAVAHLYVRTGDGFASRSEFNASLPMLEMVRREQEFVF